MKLRGLGAGTVIVGAVALQLAVILGTSPAEGDVTGLGTDPHPRSCVQLDHGHCPPRFWATVKDSEGQERRVPLDPEQFRACKRLHGPRHWHKEPGWPLGDGKGGCWTP